MSKGKMLVTDDKSSGLLCSGPSAILSWQRREAASQLQNHHLGSHLHPVVIGRRPWIQSALHGLFVVGDHLASLTLVDSSSCHQEVP